MPETPPDILPADGATLAQAGTLIDHHLRSLWAHPECARAIPPMMLWGPPGVGKSSLIRDLCSRHGIGFVDVRLSQREPIDLRGLPVPRGDEVHWLLSAEWPRDPDSRGIILFDELTAADRSLQVAAYELILDRRLGDLYQVPDGWYICAAGNRVTDRAVALSLSSALANRFCHLDLVPDHEAWKRWAVAHDVHPDVIAFLDFRPESFFDMGGDVERGWPSPRTWERVSTAVQLAEEVELDAVSLRLQITGLVGRGAATEFLAFRSWAADIPDVAAMMRGEARIRIPNRADQRYALCAAMVHYLWQGPADARERLIMGFFDISEQLPSDFAAMAMVDALTGPNDATTNARTDCLMRHPRFERWTQRHGEAFVAHQVAA
ncbi:ATP-binding protein [Salinisphaera hydrothermalis]|uniref:ATP-binding protein n=1 Tax=Salinisphaera hydrothermalis TaxID=563188 RepID=UPI003342AD8B